MDRLKLSTESFNPLSTDGMKKKVLNIVLSEQSYTENADSILTHIDPTKKNWTPFKVKKALVDQVHDIILAGPKQHPAI
mgnify:CR=1 FL=1